MLLLIYLVTVNQPERVVLLAATAGSYQWLILATPVPRLQPPFPADWLVSCIPSSGWCPMLSFDTWMAIKEGKIDVIRYLCLHCF